MSAITIEQIERQWLRLAALQEEAARLRTRIERQERALAAVRIGSEQTACVARGGDTNV